MQSVLAVVLAILSAAWLVGHRTRLATFVWWSGWVLPLVLLTVAVVFWPPFLILRKVVALFLLPTALIWMALIAACRLSPRRSKLRWALLVILVVYTLVGTGWPSEVLVRHLESSYRQIRPLAAGTYEAVLVLGGGVGTTPLGEPQLNGAGDRVRLAAALYRNGQTPILVVSSSTFSGVDVSDLTQTMLMQFGVPREAIRRLPEALNTAQEIDLYADYIRLQGYRKVGLVTSATHMRRAQALWEARGLIIDPLPADFLGSTPQGFDYYLWVIPQGQHFEKLERALWEYMGLFAVHTMGG